MIRVLVVDDEVETANAHAKYVERCEGFSVAGLAHTAATALTQARAEATAGAPIDLILLDLNLPDRHGLEVARELHADGALTDVIALTAVREIDIVRGAVAVGVVQYLIKPFTFRIFAERLEQYQQYRASLDASGQLTQLEVDRAIRALRTTNDPGLAKGLSRETLDAVARYIRSRSQPCSATELARALDLSRVTARRYLEYLSDAGVLLRAPRRGTRGRPELQYELRT